MKFRLLPARSEVTVVDPVSVELLNQIFCNDKPPSILDNRLKELNLLPLVASLLFCVANFRFRRSDLWIHYLKYSIRLAGSHYVITTNWGYEPLFWVAEIDPRRKYLLFQTGTLATPSIAFNVSESCPRPTNALILALNNFDQQFFIEKGFRSQVLGSLRVSSLTKLPTCIPDQVGLISQYRSWEASSTGRHRDLFDSQLQLARLLRRACSNLGLKLNVIPSNKHNGDTELESAYFSRAGVEVKWKDKRGISSSLELGLENSLLFTVHSTLGLELASLGANVVFYLHSKVEVPPALQDIRRECKRFATVIYGTDELEDFLLGLRSKLWEESASEAAVSSKHFIPSPKISDGTFRSFLLDNNLQ